MKKICLILGICLMPGILKAAYVDSAERGTDPGNRAVAGYGGSYAGKYYKCTTTGLNTQFSGCPGFRMYYTSIASGSGTQSDPYILNGCSLTASGTGCACLPKAYVSNGVCVQCPTGMSAAMPGISGFHTNTSCNMCSAGYYKNGDTCSECPGDGTSMGGPVPITACYLPKGTKFSDTTGSGEYTADCHYSQS